MAINVTLVNSQSDDPILNTQVAEGTTYQEFLNFNRVNTNSMVVTVRVDGERVEYALSDIVDDGARITVTPEQIKGA